MEPAFSRHPFGPEIVALCRLPVTDLPNGIDSAWPTTLPVGKPDKAARQTLPNPGKPHPSEPARQDTG